MLHRSLHAWRDRAWFPPAAAFVSMTVLSTVLLGGLGYEVADRLVHPPRDVPRVDPLDRGIPYERVSFATEDGITLQGWWMPAERSGAPGAAATGADADEASTDEAAAEDLAADGAAGTILFLHGYGASKAQSLAVAPFLHRAGYHVFAFDFRAHGESGGAYTTVGLEEVKDVVAAMEFLRARPEVDPTRVAVLGWSMGGAAGLHAAHLLPEVRSFIVDSTFARLENVVSHSLPAFTGLPHQPYGTLGILFASWMVHRSVWENDPARAIAQFDRPLLIIQGMADTIARPESDGAALHDSAGAFSELWLVPQADHVNARRVDPRAYEEKVLGFLAEHLAAPLAPAAAPAAATEPDAAP